MKPYYDSCRSPIRGGGRQLGRMLSTVSLGCCASLVVWPTHSCPCVTNSSVIGSHHVSNEWISLPSQVSHVEQKRA